MAEELRGWGVCLAAVVALASGCGYGFTAGGGKLPGEARTLYVPVFRNATAEPGIEGAFTEAFRQELSRWDRLGGEASDARVEGTIAAVQGGPSMVTWVPPKSTGTTPTAKISGYALQVVVVVRVFKGTEKLSETTVSGTEPYLAMRPETSGAELPSPSSPYLKDPTDPSSIVHPENRVLEIDANRRMALRRLAQSLMRQAYQNLTGF